MEELFLLFDETASILEKELSITYLEALVEAGENLFHQSVVQKNISEATAKKLQKKYDSIHLQKYTREDFRKSFQLAVLKGMRKKTQPNHQITPDSVGMLIAYLVQKFIHQTSFTILDPAVGTANLLTTVLNQCENSKGIGIEIDDLLIKLAYVNANLQQHSIDLINQDSLGNLFIDLADVVICDLPVGYYTNDERASHFTLKADSGHSYIHHLFIEQSIKYTKQGGYLFFLIPNHLFESPEAPKLQKFLKETVNIQGVLELPLTMFKNKNAAKSIMILQKKGENVSAPKRVLLAKLPSLSKKNEMLKILSQIDGWITENKK